jgi:hypothetical protein
MTREEIINYIETASLADVNNLRAFINLRIKALGLEVGSSFKPGDAVYFDAKRKGIINGKFVKLKQKNAEILSDTGVRWTVAPQLLRAKV